ncbi:large ribosomal subunit protein eL24-like isoform X1 [Macrobrachium nipponense]|uniref:large ribosomal subunit protein eL24-like isoform X1 n=1 Tax=Macrobrachium nipponense TaxID=159736 RepID=UPI0030C7D186
MKLQLCHYSGYKIYPGHGKTMVRTDGKTFVFLNAKCERGYRLKRNPREVRWTVLYRRKHKKGMDEETAKKRTRRTQKYQRAIVGASLTDIMAKRNMKPEVRKAQREQAIRAAKEKTRAAKATKKANSTTQKVKPSKKATQKIAKVPKAARPGGHGGHGGHGGRR